MTDTDIYGIVRDINKRYRGLDELKKWHNAR
jgi:hypothetical protein